MSIIKGVWTIMTNFKAILITITMYSVICLYGLIISFSDIPDVPTRAFWGSISFILIMFSPVLYVWIKTSAKEIMKRFNFVD